MKDYNKWYLTEEILWKLLVNNINSIIYPQFPKKWRDDKLADKYNILNFKKKLISH